MKARLAIVTLLAAAIAMPAAAQQNAPDVLTQVQPNSALVLVVPNLDKANKALEKFATDLQLPMPMPPGGPMKMLLEQMGLTDGVDMNGSMAVVMPQLQLAAAEPPIYVAVPIADEAKLMACFQDIADAEEAPGVKQGKPVRGPTVYFRAAGTHLILSPNKSMVAGFKPATDAGAPARSAGELGRANMDSGLAYAWFNVGVVGPQLAPMARVGLANLQQQALADMPTEEAAMIGGAEGVKAIFEMVGLFVNNLLTQTDAMVVSLDVNDAGVRVNHSVQFKQGSKMAALFPGDTPSKLAFDRLPEGNYHMAMAIDGRAMPTRAIADALDEMVLQKMADADPTIKKLITGYVKSIEISGAMKQMQMAWYNSGKGMEDLYRIGLVADVEDGPAYMTSYRQSQQAILDAMKALMAKAAEETGDDIGDMIEMEYAEGAQTIGGVKVDRLRMKWNMPEGAMAMNPMGAMMAKPVDTLVGAKGNTIVTTQGTGTDLFEKLLATADGSGKLGADASITSARKLLPANRIAEGYLNVGGFVKMGMDMFGQIAAQMGGQAPAMPAVPDMPPVAVAMTNKAGGLGGTVALPKKTIIAVKDFGMNAFMAMQMAPGAGPGVPPMPMPPDDAMDELEPVEPVQDDVYQPDPSADRPSGDLDAARSGDVNVVALDDSSFGGAIRGAKPTVVLFTASWSGQSRKQQAILEAVSQSHGKKATFATVDIDKAPQATADQDIKAVPTTIIFKSGKPVATFTGEKSAKAVGDLISEHSN